MDTLDMAATHAGAGPSSSLDVGAASADEPAIDCWPGWARVTIVFGSSAALWAGIDAINAKIRLCTNDAPKTLVVGTRSYTIVDSANEVMDIVRKSAPRVAF